MRGTAIAIGAAAWLVGCSFDPLDECERVSAGDRVTCPMPGVLDRAFDLHVPDSWDGASALPVIYAFHGGGGNRKAAASVTCPGGDRSDPDCMTAKATALGYAVVLPDGTGTRPVRNRRTWNAGGGVDGWQCTSGGACKSGVDDMAHLDDVHAQVQGLIAVDDARVFATGLSNGAAISNRLACERSARFAAIAPVGGSNQHAAAGGACEGGTAVLHIHGTEDPCWDFETSDEACAQDDGLDKLGAEDSVEIWRNLNGCAATRSEQALPDTADDDTSATHMRYDACDADVELIVIEGGGHTWPQGDQYLGVGTIGRVSRDFDGDDVILEFFEAHGR